MTHCFLPLQFFRIKAATDVTKIQVLKLVHEIPEEHKRTFNKLVTSAYRRRKQAAQMNKRSSKVRKIDKQLVSKESEVVKSVESREATAATLIQSSLRGDIAKSELNLKQLRTIDIEARIALANRKGFLDIATDLLSNTIFNLMDEVCYGEFDITAEPTINEKEKTLFSRERTTGSPSYFGHGSSTDVLEDEETEAVDYDVGNDTFMLSTGEAT